MIQKQNNEEPMIFLTSKLSQKKISEITLLVASIKPNPKTSDYSIWGVLENKLNATSLPNIGLLKIATEEEWNKTSEEFILKACKWFWRRANITIAKDIGHIELIYCFITIDLFSSGYWPNE